MVGPSSGFKPGRPFYRSSVSFPINEYDDTNARIIGIKVG
jgi:hypothetical protein